MQQIFVKQVDRQARALQLSTVQFVDRRLLSTTRCRWVALCWLSHHSRCDLKFKRGMFTDRNTWWTGRTLLSPLSPSTALDYVVHQRWKFEECKIPAAKICRSSVDARHRICRISDLKVQLGQSC